MSFPLQTNSPSYTSPDLIHYVKIIVNIYNFQNLSDFNEITFLNDIKALSDAPKEIKHFIFPLLTAAYVIYHEKNSSRADHLLQLIKNQIKSSPDFLHEFILNILSCKNGYKKRIDLQNIKNLLISVIELVHFEPSHSQLFFNSYSSIFNVYNDYEEFVSKNLIRLNNVDNYIGEKAKIKWNLLFLNKRKNTEIKDKSKNKTWFYLISEINFINDIVSISELLKYVPSEARNSILIDFLTYINKDYLPCRLYDPLKINKNTKTSESKLIGLHLSYSYTISTRERVPFHLLCEYSVTNPKEKKEKENFNIMTIPIGSIDQDERSVTYIPRDSTGKESRQNTAPNTSSKGFFSNLFGCFGREKSQKDEDYEMQEEKDASIDSAGIFGKLKFCEIEEKALATSKYNNSIVFPNREIISMIIKGSDELRQDYFVSQIIVLFKYILKAAGVTEVFLKEFKVISNGNGGIIQTFLNTISLAKINQINFTRDHRRFSILQHNDDQQCNLKKYFKYKFGSSNFEHERALNNFVSSLAGYSLLCYFLGIKDRNNGNILLDDEGHLIHIDFGFLLGKTPGNIKFEKAPFKLTKDFIDLMQGVGSKFFIRFQNLFYQGFFALRKEYSLIINFILIFIEMYNDLHSFSDKGEIEAQLKEKFLLDVVEEEAFLEKCQDLVYESIDNWRTTAYDNYQKYCVGIS